MRPHERPRLSELPDVFTFAELRQVVPLGETALRELTRRGVIPAIHAGRRILYSREAISRWLAGEHGETAQTSAPTALPRMAR